MNAKRHEHYAQLERADQLVKRLFFCEVEALLAPFAARPVGEERREGIKQVLRDFFSLNYRAVAEVTFNPDDTLGVEVHIHNRPRRVRFALQLEAQH